MTPIERAARAILKVRYYDCEPEMYGNDPENFWQLLDPDHVIGAQHEARVVIETLRQPTQQMHLKAVSAYVRADGKCRPVALMKAYEAWIEAALNEAPTS